MHPRDHPEVAVWPAHVTRAIPRLFPNWTRDGPINQVEITVLSLPFASRV